MVRSSIISPLNSDCTDDAVECSDDEEDDDEEEGVENREPSSLEFALVLAADVLDGRRVVVVALSMLSTGFYGNPNSPRLFVAPSIHCFTQLPKRTKATYKASGQTNVKGHNTFRSTCTAKLNFETDSQRFAVLRLL